MGSTAMRVIATPVPNTARLLSLMATAPLLLGGAWAIVPGPPPAPFLFPGGLPYPDAAICLPNFMVQDPLNAPIHVWWAQAQGGSPPLSVTLTAISVNPAEAGKAQIRLFHPSGALVASDEVIYPANGSVDSASLGDPAAANAVYRIEVQVLPKPGFPVARHYMLITHGATLLGSSGPLPVQAEAGNASWRIHVAPLEALFVLFIPGPEAGATTGTLSLINPSGAAAFSGGIGSLAFLPTPAAGAWRAVVSGLNQHYLLFKGGGLNSSFYAAWDTGGSGDLTVFVTLSGGGNNSAPMVVEVRRPDGSLASSQAGVLSSATFPNLGVGTYLVSANDAAGTEPEAGPVEVDVGCGDHPAVQLDLPPDNAGPVCPVEAVQIELWPPDHRWVEISSPSVDDPDGDTVTLNVLAIEQDEPTDTRGDGRTETDGAGVGTSLASVRAERSGNGDGRIYEITYEASDPSGAQCTFTMFVGVPHDQGNGRPAIDSGVRYDSTVFGGGPLP